MSHCLLLGTTKPDPEVIVVGLSDSVYFVVLGSHTLIHSVAVLLHVNQSVHTLLQHFVLWFVRTNTVSTMDNPHHKEIFRVLIDHSISLVVCLPHIYWFEVLVHHNASNQGVCRPLNIFVGSIFLQPLGIWIRHLIVTNSVALTVICVGDFSTITTTYSSVYLKSYNNMFSGW